MMRLVTHVLTIGFLGCAVAGCSDSKETEPDFPDPDVTGRDVNPEGVPYPTDHIGPGARSGSRAGDRIANFTFQAYVEGDRAAGLKTISLADYYDPDRLHHRILHIAVAAVWCTICSSYAEAMVIAKEPLGKEGVVYVEVMVAGKGATAGPSSREVDDWMTRHKSNFTTAIDVRAKRLGAIGVSSQTMPWDVIIDTRTMEILESSGGAPLDIAKYDRSFLKAVAARPPAY
jgi:hypothetical protein